MKTYYNISREVLDKARLIAKEQGKKIKVVAVYYNGGDSPVTFVITVE